MEQLTGWATTPQSEVFVAVSVGGRPYVIARDRADSVAAGFRKSAIAAFTSLQVIKGIPCIIIDGPMPGNPGSRYRVLISSVQPFAQDA